MVNGWCGNTGHYGCNSSHCCIDVQEDEAVCFEEDHFAYEFDCSTCEISGMSGGLIAVIVTSVIVFLLSISACIYCCCAKKCCCAPARQPTSPEQEIVKSAPKIECKVQRHQIPVRLVQPGMAQQRPQQNMQPQQQQQYVQPQQQQQQHYVQPQ